MHSPRLLLDEQYLYLYWLDSCGIGAQRRFLLEASCTALVAMSRWLAGQALPWQCSFSHAQPRYVEQYWVHLGETVRFDAPLDLMRLPREYLHQPWPGAALTAIHFTHRLFAGVVLIVVGSLGVRLCRSRCFPPAGAGCCG